jgi:plastocyanin
MQHKLSIFLVAATACGLLILRASAGIPSTQSAAATSAAAPATTGVRGHILISSGLALQKPDLSRVVVFLDSNPALDGLAAPTDHPSVSQHNKTFSPNFLVISIGTTVEFPNWDHFDHNVFSRSKAAPAFDLQRYGYGFAKARVFDKLGVVQVFCNIHPQMRAIIYVAPNPFFTRADSQGRFEIPNVPAGEYDIVAWQERCGEQRRHINVDPQAASDIALTLDENHTSIIANDPPRKRDAYGVERGLGVKREQLDLPVVEEIHKALTTAPVQ